MKGHYSRAAYVHVILSESGIVQLGPIYILHLSFSNGHGQTLISNLVLYANVCLFLYLRTLTMYSFDSK